jgi:hypothetical protein
MSRLIGIEKFRITQTTAGQFVFRADNASASLAMPEPSSRRSAPVLVSQRHIHIGRPSQL